MDAVLSPVVPPRVLIAESNPALQQLLPSTLSHHVPEIIMDVCSSFYDTLQKLRFTGHYDMVLSSVGVAEVGNFFLLKDHQTTHPLIPFIVTARAEDHERAREARANGAFDFIVAPLNLPDAVLSVQLAHKFHELKVAIALQQKKLDRLQDELAKLERDPIVPSTLVKQQKYRSKRDTLRAHEHTIEAVESSLALLSNQAMQLKDQVDQAVNTRLNVLLTLARQGEQVS